MSYFEWRPYVSVGERRRKAARELAKLNKRRGRSFAPIVIEGRTIANSFWGKSWCANLERYSDYENRLPRGRSYVRNGAVLDLQLSKGNVTAMVSGSRLYDVKITVAAVAPKRWKGICRDCAGTIDSLVELLQGRLAKGVMDRVCREGDGLFPGQDEIKFSCSCPDWADMCKHVAAALYGVGARLDEEPQLLFVLRGVDQQELLAGAGQDLGRSEHARTSHKVLNDADVAALFALDMAEGDSAGVAQSAAPKASQGGNALGSSTPKSARRNGNSSPAIRTKPGRKRIKRVAGRQKPAQRKARNVAQHPGSA